MNEYRVALERISQFALDDSSYDTLIKACDAYKIKSDDFMDDYEYHLYVSKSIADFLNEVAQDVEICKAILPGQTKNVDGIVYIWTLTPGATTTYDWRVYKGHVLAGNAKQTSKKADMNVAYVNDMFPKDISNLKVIKALGGSTGAQLVEDSKGNQYVMKKGSNTSNGHVASEYMATQLYHILGQRVPDMEMYDDGKGNKTLLSKFIPFAKVPDSSNYPDMAKGYAADALLSNWDVYKNDNILIDSAGRLVRVDNGGSLFYKAQGGMKGFDNDVNDWASMLKYNPTVLGNLTNKEKVDQINEVIKKKDDVLNFISLSGDAVLADVMIKRFSSLEKIKKDIEDADKKLNRTVLPRTLLPDVDMYREFSDDELKDFWSQANGSSADGKLNNTGKHGWELLDTICQSRGFDARPLVVEHKNYWDKIAKGDIQLFRGLDDGRGKTALYWADEFKYTDECFYGTMGYYGQGIYFHVNDGANKQRTEADYKKSDAYSHAHQYAHSGGQILECTMNKSAKVAKIEDLKKEIEKLTTFDTQAALAKQAEVDNLYKELEIKKDELLHITEKVTADIKADMHWDEASLVDHQLTIDSIDWGKLDDDDKPDYPKFDDFFGKNITKWVTSNGGTVTEKAPNSNVFILKMPNSKTSLMFSKYRYENNAIKQKNAFTNPYSYPVQEFQEWFMNNHYKVIDKAVTKGVDEMGDKVAAMKGEVNALFKANVTAKEELDALKKPKNADADVYSAIYDNTRHHNREAIGVYAALKGYDALIAPDGNGRGNSFMVVLNRSKIIVKK